MRSLAIRSALSSMSFIYRASVANVVLFKYAHFPLHDFRSTRGGDVVVSAATIQEHDPLPAHAFERLDAVSCSPRSARDLQYLKSICAARVLRPVYYSMSFWPRAKSPHSPQHTHLTRHRQAFTKRYGRFIDTLEKAIADAGGVRALARRINFSASYISSVRQGRDKPSPRLARALGYDVRDRQFVRPVGPGRR